MTGAAIAIATVIIAASPAGPRVPFEAEIDAAIAEAASVPSPKHSFSR